MKNKYKIGDTIQCIGKEDLIFKSQYLQTQGVDTSWDWGELQNGVYRLHVVDIQNMKEED